MTFPSTDDDDIMALDTISTTTISPTSLQVSSSSTTLIISASIPPTPLPSSIPNPTGRPPKRILRPRASNEIEKATRLQERKLANRTAAKQSRERQKQAMQEAQRENDRLKQENEQLLARLANLEQRMEVLESTHPTDTVNLGGESGAVVEGPTHLPARLMTEQQCPTPRLSNTTSQIQPLNPTIRSRRAQDMRIAVFILRILMHSFVLSMNLIHCPLLMDSYLHLQQRRQVPMTLISNPCLRKLPLFTLRKRPFLGSATPDLRDSSGANRNGFVRRRFKEMVTSVRMGRSRKELLRRVQRVRRDVKRSKGECIRVIIKRKFHRHMPR